MTGLREIGMVRSYEEILNTEGILCTTNVGFSMMPLLREKRDVIVIKPADREYRVLDAVLFRRPGVEGRGAYVLHRILKVLPDGKYWIVGDNCIGGEIVDRENILGILTGIRRGEKDYDFSSFGYRMYLTFWIRPVRVRFLALRGKNFARRCVGFVWRRVKKLSGRT